MRPAVFLDRDGTIIVDKGYMKEPADIEFFPGVPEAIAALNRAGYLVICVSNQSGIARGMMTSAEVVRFNDEMVRQLAAQGARIDACYFCPHHPDDTCECRKPAIGMFRQAIKEFAIDVERSWMIGDKESDIEFGKNAGLKTRKVTRETGLTPIIADLPGIA